MNLYHTILGVTFVKVADPKAWAPDVISYNVFDTKSGRFIGTTYFDLFPRPGKFSHFANWPLVPARRLADGTYRPPVTAILGNWPRPAPGAPALLSHQDVITFFHEFGHNLAALLATAPYETLSAGFRQDFVEAPSQMLENFMWEPAILKEVSSNVTTGAPLPDDLIAKMVAARYVDEAYFTLGQIKLGMVDMAYHSTGPHVDTTAVWGQISSEYTPLADGRRNASASIVRAPLRLRCRLLQLLVGARVRARHVYRVQKRRPGKPGGRDDATARRSSSRRAFTNPTSRFVISWPADEQRRVLQAVCDRPGADAHPAINCAPWLKTVAADDTSARRNFVTGTRARLSVLRVAAPG